MCVCVCVCVALLQIRSVLISPGLPGPVPLLFNRLARGILSRLNRQLVLCDSD